jgi:hypothetical protein
MNQDLEDFFDIYKWFQPGCTNAYAHFLNQSPWLFDQPNMGWRSLTDRSEQITALLTYLKENALSPKLWKHTIAHIESESSPLPYEFAFGLGQLYVCTNQLPLALQIFDVVTKCGSVHYRYYVQATAAFALGYRQDFERNASVLPGSPYMPILEQLRLGWGKPYEFAYGDTPERPVNYTAGSMMCPTFGKLV